VDNPPTSRPMKNTQRVGRLATEFVVIVLGVLIALAVDEWVDGIDDRAAERTYLAGLRADLVRDSASHAAMADGWSRSAEYGETLLGVVQGQQLPNTVSLLFLVREAGNVSIPQTAAATYEDLVSSGKLSLIEDMELRIAITEYYRTRVEDLSFFDRIDVRFRQLSRDILPPRLAEDTRSECRGPSRCVDPPEFDRSYVLDRLRTSTAVDDLLRSRIRDLIRGSEIARGRVDAISQLIDRIRESE